MMKITKILIMVLMVLSSCKKDQTSMAKEELVISLEKGFQQTLIYSLTTSGNKNGNVNESTEVKYTVDSIDRKGDYYITGEILRMTFNQEMFGEKLHFDSSEEEGMGDDFIGVEVAPLINNPFRYKISKYGEIIGDKKLSNSVVGELGIDQYNIIPLTLPKEMVSVGFSWHDVSPNPLLKDQKIETDYKIKSINKNEIVISFQSEMKGFEPFTKDAPIEGEYVFDRKSKFLKSGVRKMPVQTGGGTAEFSILTKSEDFK